MCLINEVHYTYEWDIDIEWDEQDMPIEVRKYTLYRHEPSTYVKFCRRICLAKGMSEDVFWHIFNKLL